MSGFLNRRQAALGLSLLGAPALASAADCPKSPGPPPRLMWTDRRAFAGPLGQSWLGRRFKAPMDGFGWPETPMLSPSGPVTLRAWAGKSVLITLWAEWCTPCLVEMPSLAALQARHGGPGFAIVPIVTGARTLKTPADAAKILGARKAAGFEAIVDGSPNGRALLDSLALTSVQAVIRDGCPARRTSASLPCLVILDPAGRIRGRSLGLPSARKGGNVWEEPAGEAFIRLLASGVLA